MNVRLRRHQLNWFRHKARNSELEVYALLYGKVLANGTLHVHRIAYPALSLQTSSEVKPEQSSCVAIDSSERSKGLRFLGTIHSHPNDLPVMSACDFSGHIQEGAHVSGIVEATNRRTRVAFWTAHSALPCPFDYF